MNNPIIGSIFAVASGLGGLAGVLALHTVGYDQSAESLCVYDHASIPHCASTGLIDSIDHRFLARVGVDGTPQLKAISTNFGYESFTLRRNGFEVAGDGGSADYTYTNRACSLNAGAGDDGAQIKPTTMGGCWVAVVPATGLDARVWGADANGVADSASALQAAINYIAVNGGTLRLACGVYRVSSPLVVPVAANKHVQITGAGSGCTELYFPHLIGTALTSTMGNRNSILDLAGMRVTTDVDNTTSVGISYIVPAGDLDPASQPIKHLEDVVIQGHNGKMAGQHFATGFMTYLASNVVMDRIQIYGGGMAASNPTLGALFSGENARNCNGGACYAVAFSFSDAYFGGVTTGIQLGTYAQGLVVRNSNLVGGDRNIYVPSEMIANDGISISGTSFNAKVAAIDIEATASTSLAVTGNWLVMPHANAYGIITAAHDGQIIGNHFEGISSPSGTMAVSVLTGGHHNVISGNTITNLPNSVSVAGMYNRIYGNVLRNTSPPTDNGSKNSLDSWKSVTPTVAWTGGYKVSTSRATLQYLYNYDSNQMCVNFNIVPIYIKPPVAMTVTLPEGASIGAASSLSGYNGSTELPFFGTATSGTAFTMRPTSNWGTASGQPIVGSGCIKTAFR